MRANGQFGVYFEMIIFAVCLPQESGTTHDVHGLFSNALCNTQMLYKIQNKLQHALYSVIRLYFSSLLCFLLDAQKHKSKRRLHALLSAYLLASINGVRREESHERH